jgi:hypothetical protein
MAVALAVGLVGRRRSRCQRAAEHGALASRAHSSIFHVTPIRLQIRSGARMKSPLVSVVAAALCVSALYAPDLRVATAKCPPSVPVLFPNAPDPVYVLDGKAVQKEVIARLDPKTLESIEVVCANDVHRVFGIEGRRSAVVVFTAPGPHSALTASTKFLESQQKVHLARRGVFAKQLSDLAWSDPTGLITVILTVSEDGSSWSAHATHRHLINPSSGVTVAGKK